MTTPTSLLPEEPRKPASLKWLVVMLAIVVFLAFLILTPDGLLTKADVVGYAVCHRLQSHSLTIAGRQLPLCARCSGTFIGALVGFFGQAVVLRRRRAGEFPPPLVIVILAVFMLLWAADGLNSYLTLFPNGPHLYEPQNWLRLTTGALNGLAMSALVYPVFNFTLWRQPVPERTIRNLRDLGALLLLEVGLVGLALTRWSLLLYPLALLSALGVLTLLTSVNSMLILMVMRRENVVDNWRQAVVPLLAGFTVSLIQVSIIATDTRSPVHSPGFHRYSNDCPLRTSEYIIPIICVSLRPATVDRAACKAVSRPGNGFCTGRLVSIRPLGPTRPALSTLSDTDAFQ